MMRKIEQKEFKRFPLNDLLVNLPKINKAKHQYIVPSGSLSKLWDTRKTNTQNRQNNNQIIHCTNRNTSIHKKDIININQSTRISTWNQRETKRRQSIQKIDKKKQIKVTVYDLNKTHKFILKVQNSGQLVLKLKQQLFRIQNLSISQFNSERHLIGFQSYTKNLQLNYILSQPDIKINESELSVVPIQYVKRHQKITLEDFNFLKILGSGGFSIVYLVRGKFDNKYYALKLIDKQFIISNNREGVISNQRFVLGQLQRCNFIIQMYYCFETLNHFALAIECGELFNQLKKVKKMSEEQAKFYFLQILVGLGEIHSKNIIYRDLKPENLLIDAYGHIVIADFGLSKLIGEDTMTYSFCGSPEYMAPEMLQKTGHNQSLDYYCLGALLYELVVGLPPYYSTNHQQIYHAVLNKQLEFPNHAKLSEPIKDLLRSLLEKESTRRITPINILNHQWIGKVDIHKIKNKQLKPPFIPNLNQFNFDLNDVKVPDTQFYSKIEQDIKIGNHFQKYFNQTFYYESQKLSNSESQKKYSSLENKFKRKPSKKTFKKMQFLNNSIGLSFIR